MTGHVKDIDLESVFESKNEEIFYNKLKMDIDNNDNSLRLEISSKIKLESYKFQKSLNNFLKEYKVKYSLEQLEEFIVLSEGKISEFFDLLMDERKEKLIESSCEKKIDDNMEEIDDAEKSKILSDQLDHKLNPIIYVDMENEFFKKFKFFSESQKDKIIDKCFKKYDSNLSISYIQSVIQRDKILQNILIENQEKIRSMNESTAKRYSSVENNGAVTLKKAS